MIFSRIAERAKAGPYDIDGKGGTPYSRYMAIHNIGTITYAGAGLGLLFIGLVLDVLP